MESSSVSKWAFFVLLAFLAYLAYLVLQPFIGYLLMSVVLVMIFFPVYRWLIKRMGHPKLSSLLLVLALLILLVVPSLFIGAKLIRSAPQAYASVVNHVNTAPIEKLILDTTGAHVDVQSWLQDSSLRFRTYMLDNAGAVLSSATGVAIGLFMLFFAMYYLFTDGDRVMKRLREAVPLRPQHQERLIGEVNQVVHGIIEGHLVTGMVQGAIGGVIFWILGVPNALFWGFLMVIFSVIPALGAFMVWLPVTIWLFYTHQYVATVVMLVSGLVISQIDNFLRPYIVGRYAEVHPVLVVIGVFGGLAAFGFVGFVLGPLILALFISMLRFYRQELHAPSDNA